MLGYIGLEPGLGKALRVCRQPLGELTVLGTWLPPRYSLRQLKRCGKRLKKQGVSRVLTPSHFTQWEALNLCGLRPVETGDFCRWLAPELALAGLNVPPDKATVVLTGTRATPALCQTALTLAPQIRTLGLNILHGGEGLREILLGEYGIAVLTAPENYPVDLKISFTERREEQPETIDISGDSPDMGRWEITLDYPLPTGVDGVTYLAALWDCGRLDKTKIFVNRAQHT